MSARSPRVGDMALHKSGHLDARRVFWVSPDGKTVRISIGALDSPPLPASQYTFAPPVVTR